MKKTPTRDKVKPADTWDLASLFPSDTAWEKAFAAWEKLVPAYEPFRGTLAQSAARVAECLAFDSRFERAGERLGYYAMLKTAEDQANSQSQAMMARLQNVASRAAQAASFIRPEVLALSDAKLKKLIAAKEVAPYRLLLERMGRYKPHTLSEAEERLLAMQSEMSGAVSQVFRQLTDADLKFGEVVGSDGKPADLNQSSFSVFLHAPQRSVRKAAFHQFYKEFADHENTLAAALRGSVLKDVYYARARGHASAREASLFGDNVPVAVYDNLVSAVRSKLPAVHKYLELRRRRMKLKDIHHYDTYAPILADLDKRHTWDQAVRAVLASLEPLGAEYCETLREGLTTARWCDRYPNKGKNSGAFSAGSYDGAPYILMNYQPDVLDHVFTLAHEAGHSMHSHYSARTQPFEYYGYSIFVAEVASTFNEQLLGRWMMDRAGSDRERAYLINRELDSIRATIVRQTMFAEFEQITHAMAEGGEPLTLQSIRKAYRGLLDAYFGPDFVVDDCLELECLRIPHFYNAFYVYKYATGLSAAIALSERVLSGGPAELDAYLSFLRGGCSKDPLDLLRDAGVDMESPTPVATALDRFDRLVDELDGLL